MSEVEWAVLGYDKKDKSEFIDRTPESREEAESQIARFYSRPSQYRDVRVVSRTVGEWGTPSSGVTEGKAESDGYPFMTVQDAIETAILARGVDVPDLADVVFVAAEAVQALWPAAPADDTATVLAGLRERMEAIASEWDLMLTSTAPGSAMRHAVALVEAAQQRLVQNVEQL